MRIWLDLWVVESLKVMEVVTVLDDEWSLLFLGLLWRFDEPNFVLRFILDFESNWLIDLTDMDGGLVLGSLQLHVGVLLLGGDGLKAESALDAHLVVLEIGFGGLDN